MEPGEVNSLGETYDFDSIMHYARNTFSRLEPKVMSLKFFIEFVILSDSVLPVYYMWKCINQRYLNILWGFFCSL